MIAGSIPESMARKDGCRFSEKPCANREPVMFRRFIDDESAATAIEYGLIVAVLTLAIVGGVSKYADELASLFGNYTSRVQQALK
jgi:pilus assembly protein Flp/PilA